MTHPLCLCCADEFSEDNPRDDRNPNMCRRCVRLGVDLVPEAPTAEEANAHPEGRWT